MPSNGGTVWAVGLISGTSMDGIDAAAVEIAEGTPPRVALQQYLLHPYPAEIREALLELCRGGAGGALATGGDGAGGH